MAVLVVLLPGDGKDVPVGSDVAAGLAKLGITSLTVLRDRATFAVLLEGWQFDPDRSGQSAVALLTATAWFAACNSAKRSLPTTADAVSTPISAKLAMISLSGPLAIGGFSRATLGYFDVDRSSYRPIPVEEQVEVLSLIGDIARGDDGPKVHAHVVVGTAAALIFPPMF